MDSDREETSRVKANSLAGHDHSDIPRTPTGPLTLGSDASGSTRNLQGSTPTPKHDDPQKDTSSRFGIGTSSADDRGSADHVHQRYELLAPCYE